MLEILLCSVLAFRSGDTTPPVIDKSTQTVIDAGLVWLKNNQKPEGYWSDASQTDQRPVALTAFAILAFLSQGHLPGDPKSKYGKEVEKGMSYLLSRADKNGFLGGEPKNMQDHALATLALAELHGMIPDAKVKELNAVISNAVAVIEGSQFEGTYEGKKVSAGWSYFNNKTGLPDVSVTIMQVMALRAAQMSGIKVKQDTINKAIMFIEACKVKETGGFSYIPLPLKTAFGCSAAAVCVLQFCGQLQNPAIEPGLDYLRKNRTSDRNCGSWSYGIYYSSLAMYQAGGKNWSEWYQWVKQTLTKDNQPLKDGSWAPEKDYASPTYHTSVAIIVLSLPSNYLPILQRP